jgi:hypothetical protein
LRPGSDFGSGLGVEVGAWLEGSRNYGRSHAHTERACDFDPSSAGFSACFALPRNEATAHLRRLAVPRCDSAREVSDGLPGYLDDPIVAGDDRLRRRVLIIKAETDEDLDHALSQRS